MAASSPSPPAPEASRADAAASDETAALDAVYRTGPILAAVQRARVWRDCKDFLDTPTRAPPSAVLAAWRADPPEGEAAVRAFARRWFHDGAEPDPRERSRAGTRARGLGSARAPVRARVLGVGRPEPRRRRRPRVGARFRRQGPRALADARATAHRAAGGDDDAAGGGTGAEAPLLAGTNASETAAHAKTTAPGETVPPNPKIPASSASASSSSSSFSTLIPTPRVAIVPGERFRETYYWDSYWTVLGLIASGMLVTAEGVVENLLALVDAHGFVPNGARRYYLNRAQPPVLASTVRALMEAYEPEGRGVAPGEPTGPGAGVGFDEEDEFADNDPNRPPSLAGSEPPEVVVPESDAVRSPSAPAAPPRVPLPDAPPNRRRVRVDSARAGHRRSAHVRFACTGVHGRAEARGLQGGRGNRRRGGGARARADDDAAGTPEREACAAVPSARAIRARVYRDLASAAESGHDSASRWLANEEATENGRASPSGSNWKRVDRPASLATIRTTRASPRTSTRSCSRWNPTCRGSRVSSARTTRRATGGGKTRRRRRPRRGSPSPRIGAASS